MAETVNSVVKQANGTIAVGAFRSMGLDAHTLLIGITAIAANITIGHSHEMRRSD